MAGKTREIDRQEWSRVISELLQTEANGNRTELANMVGVKYITIKRWLEGSHRVSEESVRTVARVFHLSATDLLIRVGYHRPEDRDTLPEVTEPELDVVYLQVQAAQITPSMKRNLSKYIARRRAEQEEQLAAEVARIIEAEERARRTA